MTEFGHEPVLLNETLAALDVRAGGRYVDCTVGRGGHAAAILAHLGEDGRLLAMDRDPDAVAAVSARLGQDPRVEIVHASYATLATQCRQRGWTGRVSGVLLDLGVSSPQLDDPERGFSFMKDGPLDMRFDPGQGISAADWLAMAPAKEIADVIYRYADERHSRRIAAAICREREQRPVRTTMHLAGVVAGALPRHERDRHPATRTFQAIRIFINNELDELERVLPQAVDVLEPGGRLAVISFHSVEDRIVKRFIRAQVRGDEFPPELPVPGSVMRPRLRQVVMKRRPTDAEAERNPRARSAVLRAAERLAA